MAMTSMVPSFSPARIRLHVQPGPQGRIHPGQGPPAQELVLGQGEVLRTGLTGDGDSFFLKLPDDLHRPGRGDVADVDGGSGLLGQHGVPHDLKLLRNGGPARQAQRPGDPAFIDGVIFHHIGVLTVGQDGKLLPSAPDQGVPQQVGVLHRHPVVRQGHRSGFLQRGGIGERLSLLPPGHCADGPHVDPTGLRRLLPHQGDALGAVGGGAGIGHGCDGGEPSPGGCQAAGLYGLLVLKAGLPQVDVHVHQSGAYRQPPRINDPGGRRGQLAADHRHPAVLHENVHDAADASHRVHHAALSDQ